MKCKNCGKDLPEAAKFCLECGEKVEQELVCSSCGTILPPDAKFCLECGASTVKFAEEEREDISFVDETVERVPDDDVMDWEDDETDSDGSEIDWDAELAEASERIRNIARAYIEEHSELEWVSQADDLPFYGISKAEGNEVLQWYNLGEDARTVSSIPANNFQLFRIVLGEQVEVRILAEFENNIILFDYDGRELVSISSLPGEPLKNKRRLEYMYYGFEIEKGEQSYTVLLNLITGKSTRLKYVNTYEWGFFSKNGRNLIRVTTYTQEEKRTGSLLWDDGQDGFKKIPMQEWEKLGGFPKVGSRPEQLEAKGYLRLNVSVNELTLEWYQAISELKRNSSVNTEEEVGQFIRDYLQIIGYRELKDLGDGRYYLRINNKTRVFGQDTKYAILDLNAAKNFIKRDNKNEFWHFGHLNDSLYDKEGALFVLSCAHFFPYSSHVAFDWISKPVDGKIYCLIPSYEGGGYNVFSEKHEPLPIRKKYKELYVHDINGEESGEKEAHIEVLSYKSGEKRILINLYHEEDAAFFIFDGEGNLVLKKEGKFAQAGSYFGYRMLDDNNCKHTGLYDEITGRELLPCQYFDIEVWRKKAENNELRENGEILLGGVQMISEGSGRGIDYKTEYFRYDAQSGEVSALLDTQMFPDHTTPPDECAKLGYEDLRHAEVAINFSTAMTLNSLDPEVAEEDKKKM